MGWTSSREWRSKEEVAQTLYSVADGYHYLAAPVFRREQGHWVLWSALRTPEGEGLITCILVSRENGVWGYKSMDETMEPYYYSCPQEFLTLAQPAPDVRYSRAWRARLVGGHKAGGVPVTPEEWGEEVH